MLTLRNEKFKTDTPVWILLLLAALPLPRAILHDLHTIPTDSFLYQALAVVPLLIILGFAVLRETKRPMYDFLVMGCFFGIGLAAVHLLLWDSAWAHVQSTIADTPEYRFIVAQSSVFTGLGVGVLFGLLAIIARKIRNKLKG